MVNLYSRLFLLAVIYNRRKEVFYLLLLFSSLIAPLIVGLLITTYSVWLNNRRKK
ncbi:MULTISPECIES: type I toxin-antitoxin system Fst family toxin [unclassified Listeria]|uniref:type I toxin-antitoxin system Fst family toxin n=1 Tax=unclassified Listeria TaxID=2642072 RepID=UPI000E3F9C85|nr:MULTISPECIES: type I toxin-antitoxin system Fst family toxin [unclassified Listeria]